MATDVKEPEITIKELISIFQSRLRLLKGKWLVLLIAASAGGVIGIIIAITKPVTYSSRLTFVLEEAKSGGGLSALAGEFGLEMGLGSNSSLLAGDNIVGLLKSQRFIKNALLTPYQEGGQYSLADKYVDDYDLREKFEKRAGGKISFPANSRTPFSYVQDSLLKEVVNKIKAKISVSRVDKKMTLFQTSLETKDELLTKLLTERLVDGAVRFYIETKTMRQRANVDRLQNRADSIGRLLNRQTYTTASARSQVLDVNPAFQTATVSAEVTARDKMMLATIYGEVVKNLEVQKATLTQDTPVIQVVDEAELPLEKNQLGKFKALVIGGVLCMMLVAVFLFFTMKPVTTAAR